MPVCIRLTSVSIGIGADPVDTQQIAPFHDNVIQPLLESLLPWSAVAKYSKSSSLRPTDRELSEAYLKLISLAASNNFAGVEGLVSLRDMYYYFKPIFTQLLQSRANLRLPLVAVNVLPRMASLRATAETFFRSAVEAGDAEAVRSLVLHSRSIDVNDQVCLAEGLRLTALERSAQLRYVSLTKCLLNLGADVNKHGESTGARTGPLEHSLGIAFIDTHDSRHLRCACNHLELIRILVDAGGRIRQKIFQEMIHRSHEELLGLLMPVVDCCPNDLVVKGVFHLLFTVMSNEFLLDLLQNLPVELDLNSFYNQKRTDRRVMRNVLKLPCVPSRIIDIVAQRGDVQLVKMLRERGVRFTRHSLVAAIKSKDEDTIYLLLNDYDSRWNDFSHQYFSTAFAEIIILGNRDLIYSFIEGGCKRMIEGEYEFAAGIAAASETGDVDLLKAFLALKDEHHPSALGFALLRAIVADRTEAATTLLEAGASVNVRVISRFFPSKNGSWGDPTYPNPEVNAQLMLNIALRNRNLEIVNALINHDGAISVSTRWQSNCDWLIPSLQLAVDLGHWPIIESLLESGACHNQILPALAATVRKRDPILVQRLLKCGLPEHQVEGDFKAYFPGSTIAPCAIDPLTEAINIQDMEILCMLLDANINCENPAAVWQAMQTYPEAFDMIMQKLYEQRPVRSLSLNTVLVHAVQKRQYHGIEKLLACGVQTCAFWDPSFGPFETAHMQSPLARAIAGHLHRDLALIRRLLEAGANVDEIVSSPFDNGYQDKTRPTHETALLVAISAKQPQVIELLIDWGANVNKPADLGLKRMALQKAAEVGSVALLQLLLARGADPNGPAAVRGGGTALQIAAIGGYIGIVDILLEHGADITAARSKVDGRTPVEGAAEHGRLDMVSRSHVRYSSLQISMAKASARFVVAQPGKAAYTSIEMELTHRTFVVLNVPVGKQT